MGEVVDPTGRRVIVSPGAQGPFSSWSAGGQWRFATAVVGLVGTLLGLGGGIFYWAPPAAVDIATPQPPPAPAPGPDYPLIVRRRGEEISIWASPEVYEDLHRRGLSAHPQSPAPATPPAPTLD